MIGERAIGTPSAWKLVGESSESYARRLAFVDRRLDGEVPAYIPCRALLQRYVSGRPVELKRDSRIRDTVHFSLDRLVEAGWSAAYRMRDFDTPGSA